MVGQGPSCDSVEPRSSFTPDGNLIQPTPGREEGLRHDILRVVAAGRSTKGKSENTMVVGVVERAKTGNAPMTEGG